MAPHIAYSCYVDNSDTSLTELAVWMTALLDLRGVPAKSVFVHAPDITDAALRSMADSRGITLVQAAPLVRTAPHITKVQQLGTFSHGDFDEIWLMDAGLAACTAETPEITGFVAAKIADADRPPLGQLRRIFEAAGLDLGETVPPSFPGTRGRLTQHNNVNGRLVIVKRNFMPTLAPFWVKWTRWCLERNDLFKEAEAQLEQVSLALALTELGQQAQLLPLDWNYPGHRRKDRLRDIPAKFFYCATRLDRDGHLSQTGLGTLDASLQPLRRLLRAGAHRHRGPAGPDTAGSDKTGADQAGVDKKGFGKLALPAARSAKTTNAAVRYLVEGFGSKNILEIGLTGAVAARRVRFATYRGLEEDARAAKSAQGALKTAVTAFNGLEALTRVRRADLVLAVNRLVHHPDTRVYLALLKTLALLAKDRLVVAGYEYGPENADDIKYHGPISQHLKGLGLFRDVTIVHQSGEEVVVVANRLPDGQKMTPSLEAHARMLQDCARLSDHPIFQRHMMDITRRQFGFFTQSYIKALEMPWLAARVRDKLSGTHVLDMGSGLSPVPFFLSDHGATVDTVDNSALICTPSNRADWRENGFFDYGRVSAKIRSTQGDILSYTPKDRFAIICGLGLLHQLDAGTRRAVIQRCATWLTPGGHLYLSLHLIPGTDWLWPKKADGSIAAKETHGHATGVLRALAAAGFAIVHQQRYQALPNTAQDLMLVECRRKS